MNLLLSNKIIRQLKMGFICILTPFIFTNCNNIDPPVQEIEQEEQAIKKTFYKGTTMGFAAHLEEYGNVVYKENEVPKDPFQSLFDHGANMVRLRVDPPPYSNKYSEGYPDPDFRSPQKVKLGLERAIKAGLNTLLTFSYQSMALNPENRLNNYVAPLQWQTIAHDLEKLKDSVYRHTQIVLEDYVKSGIIPEIVSIGNEISWRFLEKNEKEKDLPAYSPSRSAALLNSGIKAVRDINSKYNLNIQIACHVGGVNVLKWWMETHMMYKVDFDIMGLSHYHGWGLSKLENFSNWKEMGSWLKNNYNKKFMILEVAQLFTTGGSDNHVDILGTSNIPSNYPNPPTTDTQKDYLKDFAQEIQNARGIGVIVWGGEWVGSDCLIYPDQWGAGSSWENKAFWDFNYNLHDGVNWMKEIKLP